MTAGLYPRPSRERIAGRVNGQAAAAQAADDALAELEAALWRLTGSKPDTAVALVDSALDAARRYATAAADKAAGRYRLAEAAAEYGRPS